LTDNLVFVLVKLIILKSGPKSPLERGGPLAVGCVFFETALLNGPRRQCVFQSAAALSPRSGTGLGKRSLHWRRRFSPFDWPAQQTGFFPSCEAASLPRMILRASLPPGSFGASLPGMLFPESLLNGVGIASADVFRRLASCFNGNWPSSADMPAFNAPLCFFHRILHYKERRRHVLVCLTSCLKA